MTVFYINIVHLNFFTNFVIINHGLGPDLIQQQAGSRFSEKETLIKRSYHKGRATTKKELKDEKNKRNIYGEGKRHGEDNRMADE